MILEDGTGFRVQGPITMRNVVALLDEGRRLFADGRVVVDLSEVSEVDSTAVSLLLQWVREAGGRGQRLEFRNLPSNLRSLATLYGVTELIPGFAHGPSSGAT
jgi:phospholipid transport system transporter-binding protein